MTTMQLECFLAVAETLNFARAALKLNVTQPAVTQQIRSLEEELGVQLFKRTTRMVRLTPEGHIFLGDAQHILQTIRFTRERFRDQGRKERKPFTIGCHSYDDLELLPDVLKGMAEACPALHPFFQVVPFQHLYRLLAEEAVDVVIAFKEKDVRESYGTYREFGKIPVVGILAAKHPLAGKASLSPEELAGQRLLLNDPQKCPGSLNAVQHEMAKGRTAADLLFCDNPPASLLLAKAGFGIAVLPKFLAGNDPALACIPVKGAEPLSYGAYYKSIARKPLLKLFLQLCGEYFPSSIDRASFL